MAEGFSVVIFVLHMDGRTDMQTATHKSQTPVPSVTAASEELTDWDRKTYLKLISNELSAEQIARISTPAAIYPRQTSVLAVHWHPEFVPMDVIRERITATFPNHTDELIIPTQHNILMNYDSYAGVEVDCYSPSFKRKVQLLIHFEAERVGEGKADVFKSMLAHTFKYRSRQLFEFIDTVINPEFEDRVQEAATRTGAEEDLVAFARLHTRKLKRLFDEYEPATPPAMIKNKILTHYFDALCEQFDPRMVNHATMFLKAIKAIVKAHFSLEFFYRTEEIIEEVRGIGGGIVIPHPEQFWPILLEDYDVDGYEVWNPQSQEYTEFHINVVDSQNKTMSARKKPVLIFMGDDCHMGEKARDPQQQDPEKAGREIGVQPAWDDLAIRKSLIVANANRKSVIDEYKARLSA